MKFSGRWTPEEKRDRRFPDLLSEVLLDSLIVTGLWRRFRNHPGIWNHRAPSGSHGSALLTVAMLWLLGMVLQVIDHRGFPGKLLSND